jgi:hypothetical protein
MKSVNFDTSITIQEYDTDEPPNKIKHINKLRLISYNIDYFIIIGVLLFIIISIFILLKYFI